MTTCQSLGVTLTEFLEQDLDRQDAALALLKDLVENQSACFTGDEAAVFSLLFRMRESNSRSVSRRLTHRIITLIVCGLAW